MENNQLNMLNQQKSREKERHEKTGLDLEQKKNAENQRYQKNMEMFKNREQSIKNSLNYCREYLDRLMPYADNLNKKLSEFLTD